MGNEELIKGIFFRIAAQKIQPKEIDACFENFNGLMVRVCKEYYKTLCHTDQEKSFWNICESALFAKHLREIFIRTLIREISLLKEKLQGVTPEKEYRDYIQRYLTNIEYIKGLYQKYPVLFEELFRCVEYYAVNLKLFVDHLKTDIDELERLFVVKGGIIAIAQIIPISSDYHNQHQFIVVLRWKDGKRILYKPHTVQNEYLFYKLQNIFCGLNGLAHDPIKILDKASHGWMSYIEQKECRNDKEVKEYYYRYGILLFNAYLLQARDLHYENLIASGVYPTLIDLEAAVDLRDCRENQKTANETIKEKLRQSVYNSGLLPLFVWSRDGKGMNVSGISGRGGQILPIKIPVIKNKGTSNICIGYEYGRSPQGKNLVILNGKTVDPYFYIEELEKGFSDAYQTLNNHTGRIKNIVAAEMKNVKVRYLVRNTQEYSMILSLAYHPNFLENTDKRKDLLRSLLNISPKVDEKIVNQEMKSILEGDIPMFYSLGRESHLYSNGKVLCKDYFKKTPLDRVMHHIDTLTEEDIRFQLSLIETTMSACQNSITKKVIEDFNAEEYLSQIVQKIKKQAVYNADQSDVSWLSNVNSDYGERKLILDAMDDYLYSGKMGILVFLKAYLQKREDGQVARIAELLENYYFMYTDGKIEEKQLERRPTGAFTGEGSIVYGYEILYQITNKDIFLQYAEKHAEYLMRLLETDQEYDLLGGNAGAIAVFVNLFQLTKKKKYLQGAEQAFTYLKKNIVRYDQNRIGIRNSFAGQPLAGVAHGCSGYILALSKLAFYSSQKKDINRYIHGFLNYEESLYDEKAKDWRDLRFQGRESSRELAWCHGKAGILYTYKKSMNFNSEASVNKHLERILNLRNNWESKLEIKQEDGLCHGNTGIYVMLSELFCGEYRNLQDFCSFHCLQENDNLGFMTGCTGIGYYLLKQTLNLPNILIMESSHS